MDKAKEATAGTEEAQLQNEETVDAVKLFCPSDQPSESVRSENIKLPFDHPIFECKATTNAGGSLYMQPIQFPPSNPNTGLPQQRTSHGNTAIEGSDSEISELIGMPLCVMKCTQARTPSPGGVNNRATFMMMCLRDPTSENWGLVLGDWLGPAGTVLVARKDRQPLSIAEAEAFGDFCSRHLVKLIQQSDEDLEYLEDNEVPDTNFPIVTKQHVLEEATPVKWAEFFAKWQAGTADIDSDEGW